MLERVEDGVTWTQTYNAENRLASVSDGEDTWSFTYDGDGRRVRQVGPDGEMTLYLGGGAYEVRDATGDAEVVKYYGIAGQRVALSGPEGMQYLLTDHLGSVSAVLDAAGNLLAEQRYTPFGEARFDIALGTTDFGYTGQRALAGTGLMDYNARFYAPSLGRFMQPDSIVPGTGNPQALNRLSYVVNNPINFSDPSGYCPAGTKLLDGVQCTPKPAHVFGTGGSNATSFNLGNDELDAELTSSEPNAFCLASSSRRQCLVLMPEDASPAVMPAHSGYAFGIPILDRFANVGESYVLRLGRAFLTAGVEGGEAIGSLLPPIAVGFSVLDVLITTIGCMLDGQCYYGSPGQGLPDMIVVDQDLIVTVGDLLVGTAGYAVSGPIVDAITSASSLVYDELSLFGVIPNYISVGFSTTTDFLLIYK